MEPPDYVERDDAVLAERRDCNASAVRGRGGDTGNRGRESLARKRLVLDDHYTQDWRRHASGSTTRATVPAPSRGDTDTKALLP